MKPILKQFAEWAIALRQNEFRYATVKLTLFYVLSTAVILVVTSAAVLILFTPPEAAPPPHIEEMVEMGNENLNTYEIREHLEAVIALVDLAVLLIVSVLSYQFARNTLLPIKLVKERQQQFMGDVAHELRTPLAVLKIGAETLLRNEHRTAEYKEFVVDVKEESARLTRLSNQLLKLLHLGTVGLPEVVRSDLSKLAQNESNRFALYAEEHGVSLKTEIEPDIHLVINPDDFIQILQNLLKNAIDYNVKEGSATVTLRETEGGIELAVVDTGIGIPADKQQAIFARFTKLNQKRSNGAESGSGLGLSIVKELANRYRATIDVGKDSKQGTCITVRFPSTRS